MSVRLYQLKTNNIFEGLQFSANLSEYDSADYQLNEASFTCVMWLLQSVITTLHWEIWDLVSSFTVDIVRKMCKKLKLIDKWIHKYLHNFIISKGKYLPLSTYNFNHIPIAWEKHTSIAIVIVNCPLIGRISSLHILQPISGYNFSTIAVEILVHTFFQWFTKIFHGIY